MFYNMHTHTNLSHDAKSSPEEICEGAIKAGLKGIAFSDHCDPHVTEQDAILSNQARRFEVYGEMAEKYGDRIFLMNSIELGDAHLFFEKTQRVAAAFSYDCIIGSVHVLRAADGNFLVHTMQAFDTYSPAEIDEYLKKYFDGVLFTAKHSNIDILAHLTLPIRYITGKYGIMVDMEKYMPTIIEILKTIIERGIALEINTSEVGLSLNETLPSNEIIKLYRSLGGELLTLGSDAHVVDNIALGLKETREMLKSLNIEKAFYYKDRKPYSYSL